MRPIHFITIMRFAKDNNLASESFNSVIATIEIKAKDKEVSVEEYLEQY